MSEPSLRPDVAAVLQALRSEADSIDLVRIGSVGLVKQISDQAAEILGMEKLLQPTVGPVIDSLNRHASQISNRVRFTDVGTVQRIGDGVAKLSGLPSARTEELVTFPTGVQGMVVRYGLGRRVAYIRRLGRSPNSYEDYQIERQGDQSGAQDHPQGVRPPWKDKGVHL